MTVDEMSIETRLHFGSRRSVPMIRQIESAECGLACLAMISAYFDQHVELLDLRRTHSIGATGTNIQQLVQIAESLDLTCRPLRLELHELGHLKLPCILHWDLNHFVVLVAIKRGRAIILDPASGERTIPLSEIGKHFTGIALEVFPGPKIRRIEKKSRISLRELSGSIRGVKRSLLQLLLLSLCLEFFALVTPQMLQIVVDRVLVDFDMDLLSLVGIGFIVLLMLQVAISAMRSWVATWIGSHLSLSWSGNVFQHLLKLPQSYFYTRLLGDIASRFGTVANIQQTLTTRFIEVILDGFLAFGTVLALFVYRWQLALITVGSTLVYASLRVLYFRIYRESNLNQILANAKQQSMLLESIRAVQGIRLFNGVGTQTSRYLNSSAEAINTSIRIQRLGITFSSANSLVLGLQRVGVIWLGALQTIKGNFTVGMLMAFIAYADQFTSRASKFIDYLMDLRLLPLQTERLADIVLTPVEANLHGSFIGRSMRGTVRLNDVSFRYSPFTPWILKNCNVEIAEGSCVVIIGQSGAGKSTLLRLVSGLLDPSHGTIEIDGVDLSKLGKTHYRTFMSCVMQDDNLLTGSVAENISYFDTAGSLEEVMEAARAAEIHDDIMAMPMGYQTMVGDMGSILSGGQYQRILLARALYRRPRILILDEATSNVDIGRERRIYDTLADLQITRIIVTHRQEGASIADRVYLLSNNGLHEQMHS